MDFPSQVWRPAPAQDMSGPYDGRGLLDDVEHISVPGAGPEDVVFDDEALYTGFHDGRIVRVPWDGGPSRLLGRTGGRPLGIEWLPDGDVLVCDAEVGLLRVPREGGDVEHLVTHLDGAPVGLVNNAAVEADGTIWFTVSTRCNPLDDMIGDILEHNDSGRLLRRDPDGTVEEVLGGLSFANGVTLVGDDEVWVAESAAYSIHRVTRTGPRAGATSLVTDGLPGFPDNLDTGADGTIWAPLPNPRNALGDVLKGLHPAVREVVRRIPDAIRDLLVVPFARVLGFAPDGSVRHDLRGDGAAYSFITSVRERDGMLYLCSLEEDVTSIGRIPVPGRGT